MILKLKEDVIKRIQMAISLYESGNDYFKKSYDILKFSIGIILLQDAVEMFLSALCEQLDISMTGRENFINILIALKKKLMTVYH